jgi:hypothetical protein
MSSTSHFSLTRLANTIAGMPRCDVKRRRAESALTVALAFCKVPDERALWRTRAGLDAAPILGPCWRPVRRAS